VNRGLKFDDARLYLTTPSPNGTLMLTDNVDATNYEAVVLREDLLHSTSHTAVVARDHLNCITLSDPIAHPTYSCQSPFV
jgi:hypothetical protein